MVDLVNQHNRMRKELTAGINKVIDEASFIHGPAVEDFEQELAQYLNIDHVIGCANGTDALKLALMALDLPRGSEVIVPAFTFVAPAEVTALLGLKPVFADVNPYTFTIETQSLEELISDDTRAIIPVHLFGQCADMENITNIASKHNLYVIEDNAQALGAKYYFSDGTEKQAGTMGHIGCTSFFPSKNLGCMGDGGAIFTDNPELKNTLRILKNHGQSSRNYEYERIGLNSRLDGMQAAILNVKLPHLDDFIERRQKVAYHYEKALLNNQKISTPYTDQQTTHTFHQYTLKMEPEERAALCSFLEEHQIPSKIYYPLPLHQHEAYRNISRVPEEGLPNSESLSKSVLSIPIHSELEEQQLQHITTTLNNFFVTT